MRRVPIAMRHRGIIPYTYRRRIIRILRTVAATFSHNDINVHFPLGSSRRALQRESAAHARSNSNFFKDFNELEPRRANKRLGVLLGAGVNCVDMERQILERLRRKRNN
ncbi:hypothetical protein V8G54_010935 [Vigna mungo]|uniref:Uncharacterized protein n=1 Tax=Vigna mungo TaxID=3915 RepID=A0AAQ3S2K4_VIGMU